MTRYTMPGRLSMLHDVKRKLRRSKLNTVCEEAKCPNIAECFGCKTATFLIMGEVCTRACRFCAIRKGKPEPLDPQEPERLAEAVDVLGIRHAVITSVTRDDLEDGGAVCFAACIREINKRNPQVRTEVLIPDFQGDANAVGVVLDAGPSVMNHNIETVPRLYRDVRPKADFMRSLNLIAQAASRKSSSMVVKSGMMVGLGENEPEVYAVLKSLQQSGCDIVTIGQYLRPTKENWAVHRDVSDQEFARYQQIGHELGMMVIAGPLVRSSYKALDSFDEVRRQYAGSIQNH